MPDTGASQTIVSAAVARDAKLSLRPMRTELRNASGTVMDYWGKPTQYFVTINIRLFLQCSLQETLTTQL